MDSQLTWDALAAELNVNRRNLMGWKLQPDAPKNRNPADWRLWLSERQGATDGGPRDITKLPGTCSYDEAVASNAISYADAKVREQVIAEQLANDKLRGSLLTKEAHREKLKSIADKVLTAIRELPDLVANEYEPHERSAARKRAENWRDAVLMKAAHALNAG